MIEAANEHDKPVRIGVNWGSLDSAVLTRMMDANAQLAEPLNAMMNAVVESALGSARRVSIVLRHRHEKV